MTSNTIEKKSKKKFSLTMPHTYIILAGIILFCSVLTYVIPAGEFDRVIDAVTGKSIIVADSYHRVAQNPVGFFDLFIDIHKGLVEAADIIFFIYFAYAFVFTLIKTGALDAAIGALLRKIGDKVEYIIPIFMIFFGILGATAGLFEEVYGLIPAFVGIAIALGYDGLVGGAIVFVGVATGFAGAMINPFTVGVAQGVAGVPMFSGLGFRFIVFVAFQSSAIIYTMRYARKIRNNPELSLVKDVEFSVSDGMSREALMATTFTTRHKLSITMFVATIGLIVFGTLKLGWYIPELAGLFLVMMIVVGLIGGFSMNKIAGTFVEAVAAITFGALVVGLAHAILIVMQDGMIIDTVVNTLATAFAMGNKYLGAIGMLFAQNIINFFIPSGSGQAATSMPIMAPLADLLGLRRQIAVLAFQFGDGFSNLFWPTSIAVQCGLMGIPINKWYKFIAPLFGVFVVLEVIFMMIAVAINYGPV